MHRAVLQGEFPLDLVPVDDDVLSLELDAAFRWSGAEPVLPCLSGGALRATALAS
jgi:hypothetical protein